MPKEFIDIVPFENVSKLKIDIPGSKSISNRALILSVLNDGIVKLRRILKSDDVDIMISALRNLGIKIQEKDDTIIVHGTGGYLPIKKANIEVGNAGTVARFLTALLALQDRGEYLLDGTDAMRKRPMKGLLKALEIHGCKFEFINKDYHFPFKMVCSGLDSGDWIIDASTSSQILSAILIIAPYIKGNKTIQLMGDTVSKPFVKMTMDMMSHFAENNEFTRTFEDKGQCTLGNFTYRLKNDVYEVEPDATAASYFLSLPISVKGIVLVNDLQNSVLQGDIKYSRVLSKCGLTVDYTESGIQASFTRELDGGTYDFNDISDTFLTLAALSPILKSPLKITGIEHTRHQETDRVSGMAKELKKLLHRVDERDDSLHLFPHENLNKFLDGGSVSIETYDDHRFAMSFAVLGCYNLYGNFRPWIRILDPLCCGKTFPTFFDKLQECRMNKG